jgi:hypothetical protein
MPKRVHQNRDEGQSGDIKSLKLADIRGEILNQITDGNGLVSWSKANAMGQSFIPTMAASTIINFATGETPNPSTWTIRKLTEQADMEVWLLPKGAKPPKGAVKFE